MTEIKTAQAWGSHDLLGGLMPFARPAKWSTPELSAPVVIVHGLTEAEVHEAAALLEKSREVCEHRVVIELDGITTVDTSCNLRSRTIASINGPRPCWCGKKVKIVARPAGERWW